MTLESAKGGQEGSEGRLGPILGAQRGAKREQNWNQNAPHFRSVFSSNFALNLEHFGSQNDADLNTLSAAKGLAKAACT